MSTLLKSSNFSGYNGSHFELRLEYDLVSQSTDTNQSKVKYYLKMSSSGGYSGSGSSSNGYINNNVVGSFTSIGVNTTITVGTREEEYKHNEDGTKSVSYSASISTNWSGLGNASVSGTLTLPTIKRKSVINSFVGNDLGGTFSATYTSYVSSYKQKLRLSIGSTTIMTTDNYVSGAGVTLNSSALTAVKNYLDTNSTNKVVLSATIETWNGSTKIGDSATLNNECTFVGGEPTLSHTRTETNSKVVSLLGSSSATKIIKNASKIRFDITATGKNGATITKTSVTHEGTTKNDTTSPYQITIDAKSGVFKVIAIDNRTNKKEQNVNYSSSNVINYLPVDITSISFTRTNPTSSTIKLNLTATFYSSIGGTTNTPTIKWRLGTGSWHSITSGYTISSNKLKITNMSLGDILDYTDSGDFTLQISDLLTSDQDTKNVTRGIPTYDYGEHDLKVNGDLYIADTRGENKKSVLDLTQGKVLWTNSSPTSSFGGQTITLSNAIENYSYYEIIYRRTNSSSTIRYLSTGRIPVESGTGCDLTITYYYNYIRTASSISGTSMTFGNCSQYATYGSSTGTTSNTYAIPYKVIGYK